MTTITLCKVETTAQRDITGKLHCLKKIFIVGFIDAKMMSGSSRVSALNVNIFNE